MPIASPPTSPDRTYWIMSLIVEWCATVAASSTWLPSIMPLVVDFSSAVRPVTVCSTVGSISVAVFS
jgi:hypothetical protein